MNTQLNAPTIGLHRYKEVTRAHVPPVTVLSKLHLFSFRWSPEEGSPRSQRIRAAYDDEQRRRKLQFKGVKIHWKGPRCVHVVGSFASHAKGRTVDGAAFDQVKRAERCTKCHYEFENA